VKKLSPLLLLILCVACPSQDSVPEPEIPVVEGTEWCERAEKNLVALGCEEGKPTKKGKSFAQVCKETQDNGVDLNPKCLSTIKSCDQIDKECAWNQP
jgi:hypothetical protein